MATPNSEADLNHTINILLMAGGGMGTIVHRCGWLRPNRSMLPYITTMPRYKTYGGCKVGIPDPNVIRTFTCEVRWGNSTGVSSAQYITSRDEYVLGADDDRFVFLGTIIRCTFKETERAIAEISGLTQAVLTDTWKPTVNNGRMTLQRLFTIEIRVDFKDEDKLPIFKTLIQQAGRHVYGQGALLQDGVKPEIVIHSHDFFKGHQDIPLFEDAVLSGETAVVEATSRPFEPALAGAPSRSTGSPLAGGGEPAPDGFSEDFMRELKQ